MTFDSYQSNGDDHAASTSTGDRVRLENAIGRASSLVVASDQFKARTMSGIAGQRRRRHRRPVVLAGLAVSVLAIFAPAATRRLEHSAMNHPWYTATFLSAGELQQQAVRQSEDRGSEIGWAMYEIVAKRRSPSP